MSDQSGLLNLLIFLSVLISTGVAIEVCDTSRGRGICPELNTCCRVRDGASGCIPNDLGGYNGTCCDDEQTGCAVGYTCGPQQTCLASQSVRDPLVQVLPRYVLCHPTESSLSLVHGLKIDGVAEGELAYYSTHGDINQDTNDVDWSTIATALLVIHGSLRNADDYFCAACAAVAVQNHLQNKESILVLAPRFLVPSDGPVYLTSGGTPLRWKGIGDGPWRYGASAIAPRDAIQVSSYHAVDQLIAELGNSTKFPGLRNITIVGHSSGGQFVQRWSLLTSRWYDNAALHMRAVVANPSSYAYLTKYRFHNGAWVIPSNCPQYNKWEWGFDVGGEMDVPYKDDALHLLRGNLTRLAERFAKRQVLYLAGSLDRCNTTSAEGWCNSHGLETSCMDESQGQNRWERNLRYFASLQRIGITTHKRVVVKGVGHDHSLMFSSPEGIHSLFGGQLEHEQDKATNY